MTLADLTVHLLYCPHCLGYHRLHIKQLSVGGELRPEEMPSLEMLFPTGPTKCPQTGKVFDAVEDDWLHLTEDEYHQRFPGSLPAIGTTPNPD